MGKLRYTSDKYVENITNMLGCFKDHHSYSTSINTMIYINIYYFLYKSESCKWGEMSKASIIKQLVTRKPMPL